MMSNDSVKLIDGMTDAYANQLMAIGLDTYYEIYRLKPSTLMEKLNDPSLDADTVARWQKDAVTLAYTCVVTVTVLSKDGQTPIQGAAVTAGEVSGVTDEQGIAVLYRVRIDCTAVEVSAQGYITLQAKIDLRADKEHKVRFSLVVSTTGGHYHTYSSEYKGQYISVRAGDIQRIRTREIAELPSGTYLQAVRENADKGTVQLVSLYREKDGPVIYTDRVELAKDQLPSGITIGGIAYWEGGSLQATNETKESIALALRETGLGIPKEAILPRIIFNDATEKQNGSATLPNLTNLSEEQRAVLRELFAQYPDGVPYYAFKNTVAILELIGGSTNVV